MRGHVFSVSFIFIAASNQLLNKIALCMNFLNPVAQVGGRRKPERSPYMPHSTINHCYASVPFTIGACCRIIASTFK
jgi:hypothetical protein